MQLQSVAVLRENIVNLQRISVFSHQIGLIKKKKKRALIHNSCCCIKSVDLFKFKEAGFISLEKEKEERERIGHTRDKFDRRWNFTHT